MQLFEVPLFNSIIHDISGRKIPDSMFQDGWNVSFEDGNTIDRMGLQAFLDTVPDPVKRVYLYQRMFTDEKFLLVFTTKEIFRYDEAAISFKNITRNFNKGTASSTSTTVTISPPTPVDKTYASGGSSSGTTSADRTIVLDTVSDIYPGMHITGTGIPTNTFVERVGNSDDLSIIISNYPSEAISGTLTFTWHFNPAWDGVYYQVAFSDDSDAPDIDDETLTWYDVAVDTTTTLVGTGLPTISDKGYILKMRYSGDEDDMWHIATPYSAYLDDNYLLATNGIDVVQEWTGEDSFIDFAEYKNICEQIGYWGTIGNGQILCIAPYDTGTGSYNVNAIEVSDPVPSTVDASVGTVAAVTQWDYGVYYALYNETSGIVGCQPLGDSTFVIYKKNSISTLSENPNYSVTDPFLLREGVKRNLGVPNIDVVSVFESYHLFFSGENFYVFDGINESVIGEGNISYILKNMNKNYLVRSFAVKIPEKNLYLLFLPFGSSELCNVIVVLNYKDKSWTFWSFLDSNGDEIDFTSSGKYLRQFLPTWGSFLYTPVVTSVSTDATLTCTSGYDFSGVEAGMHVTGTGIPDDTTVSSVTDTTHLELSAAATATGTISDLKIGYYPSELPEYRWMDLKAAENFTRIVLGTNEGNVFEISQDYYKDDDVDIISELTTKDFELNKGLTFLFMEAIVRIGLRETSDGYLTGEVFQVRASVDYGRSWSRWQNLALDPLTEDEGLFMEKKAAFHMRGKAVRLQFRFNDPFILESVYIKWNPMGQSFKYNR